MREAAAVLLFLALAPASAAAQAPPRRAEVFAGAGWFRVGADEGSLGRGVGVGGGLGFRLSPRFSLEMDLTRTAHRRDIAGGPLEGTVAGAFGSAVYDFGGRRARVFVAGSAGVARSKRTHAFPSGGVRIVVESDDTSLAWGGGAGVRLFLTPRFSLRPQFRIVFSEATGVMGLTAATVSAGYHW